MWHTLSCKWSFVPNIEWIHPELNMLYGGHSKMCHILAVLFAKSLLNDLEVIGRGQRSLCMTHPLMLVIICAKYGKNPSRTVHAVEWTRQDVLYFSSFIAKSWLNDLEDIGQGQRSLHMTHPLMIANICAKYGNNPSRTVCAGERT